MQIKYDLDKVGIGSRLQEERTTHSCGSYAGIVGGGNGNHRQVYQ